MKKGLKIFVIGLLGIVFLVLIMTPKVKRFFEIDKCLDNGGRWNYDLEKCEFADSLIIKTDTAELK